MSAPNVTVTQQLITATIVEEAITVAITSDEVGVITIGEQGPAGPPGPAGPAGGAFTYTQPTPADTWTIAHGLGFPPNITVIDSAGSVVEGDIAYPDINTVVLSFAGAFSGTAYLS